MPTHPSSPHRGSPSGLPSRGLAAADGREGTGQVGGTDRERVREASPIDRIVADYGVTLRGEGRGAKALCPFHREKTPSFYVDAEKGTYRCYGCNAYGDVFSFVERMEGVDFIGALRALAERAGIALTGRRGPAGPRPEEKKEDQRLLLWAAQWYESQRRGREGEAAREYLGRRGFRDATIDAFGIGYAPPGHARLADALRARSFDIDRAVRLGVLKRSPEGRVYDAFRQRVIFPIRDTLGRVVGFGGRFLEGDPGALGRGGIPADPPPKYLNSPESDLFRKGEILYGQYEGREAIRERKQLLLMEGYTDVMMAHQAGFGHAVATLGTALTPANVERIARSTQRVVFVFDGDRAGIEAARKAVLLLAPRPIETRVAIIGAGEDPAELLARPEGAERFRGLVESGTEAVEFILDRCFDGEDPGSAAGRDRIARAFGTYVSELPSEILRGTALERLAGRLGVPLARVERDFRDSRAPRPAARAATAGEAREGGEALPHEEEGILLAALALGEESAVVFRLQPPERFRDPLLGRLAARLSSGGSDLDPRGIESQEEKAKALELFGRGDELGFDAESAMRLLVELVRRHLRTLAQDGPERRVGEADPGWIRRIIEIRRVGAELAARPPHEPQALVEILDRFDPVGIVPAEAEPAR